MVGRAIAMEAQIVKNKAPNDKSGVLSEAMDFLALFADPLVRHTTSASDFHLGDLQDGGEPMSLYYVIPRSDMSRLRPLMRMHFNLLCRGLRDNEPRPTTLPLDLILDEFTALGHMDFYEQALAFMRGYKMRATHVVQSLASSTKPMARTMRLSTGVTSRCSTPRAMSGRPSASVTWRRVPADAEAHGVYGEPVGTLV